ncbi:hypothetical protein ACFSCV_18850 [Methylopila henanensis]|uniref:DUF2946 domain-containing protein n=1 Tax=Methylopila henanensis TaxID=873516 RepID=A0ABW4KFY7_9HYPH
MSKTSSSKVTRFCARLAMALCLVLIGLGGAVERGQPEHAGLDSEIALAVSTDAGQGTEGADGKALGSIDHGCHGCAAVARPLPLGAATLVVFQERLAWASAPSASGREPLIDLPPPRA